MSDSQLVISQIKREYEVKELILVKYIQMARKLLEDIDYDLQRIPGEKNGWMDALAKLANTKATMNNRTIIQETL